jgi:hypothetical protein
MPTMKTDQFEIGLQNINGDGEFDEILSIVTGEAQARERVAQLNANLEKENPEAYKTGTRFHYRPRNQESQHRD